ncbi:hypothetical protein INS49_000724 [Diaporthe citri]|uniref:uncharacterized protein n=1 Tax=Diaporthe citri TaxID=83186 RepID=UPI001C7FAEE0|nr:uncharacterized protein INS49_000724 [Diaporthe citri]KAG6366547.1 hypothetical protein INS49_000724 [Diaporthe citri]
MPGKRKRPAAGEEVEPPAGVRSPDSRAAMATPIEPVAGVSDLDQFLSVPKSDKELETELERLGRLILQHVEENYVTGVRHPREPLDLVLWNLGLRSGESTVPTTGQLEAMAMDPNKRVTALQHIIARVIFGSLSVKWAGKISMLPPSVSSLVQEMPPCEKDVGDPEAISVALTRWRQLTAFLLQSSVPYYAVIDLRARQLVKEMNRFLWVFVDEKNRKDQEHNLKNVVTECALIGHTIFSQPEDFTWEFGSGDGRYVVVCPGLVKACFNLVLILRNDTQYLISLRNDNLQAFEEIDTARPVLSQINGAITAATRSIYELGPFLERHRWPPCEPPRTSIIRLKNLRKRSSLSSPVSGAAAAARPGLSPDELFSWTLALTAQHTAVLSALDQLEKFLVYGSADISEDDRRRHDATGSWWQQRHSEITTTPLPPLVGLQALIPEVSQRARSATLDPSNSAHAVSPLSPYSPLLSPPGLSRHSSQVSLPSPVQASPTVDTPFTPLNQQVATMFEQKTLPSKTIQPVIHELDNMIASPADSMQPVFELDVSPVGNSHYTQSPSQQEDDKHWPYLAYMARKQAVTMSRWSVRRSKSTKSKTGSDS